ncbi:sugar transferase [Cellulomonas alba]|uniref:Sugar transferase n=1 Tax=Cellulomonas alba TaxID=3053467 RepID=A0ABT7SHC0_9CELL|nr:sugar transferase [Cellulomonas alba]MDM7855570.1 sugar transferase [Cellulomonas alba]
MFANISLPGGVDMTLTADRGLFSFGEGVDRRAASREPRRSWASPEPFVRRATTVNADGERRANAWRSAGTRYAAAAASLDAMCAAVVGSVVAILAVPDAAGVAVAAGAASVLLFVALVAAFGGYRQHELGDGPAEFQAVARASGALAALLVAWAFVFRTEVPRPAVLVGVPLVAAASCLLRYARRRRLHAARREGAAMRGTIVVGDPASAARVVRDLSAEPHHGYRIDGLCIPDAGPLDVEGVPVVGGVADVVQVVADRAAEVVIVSGSCLSGEAMRRLSWALGRVGADLVVVPDLVEVSGPRLSVRPTAGLSLLEVEVDAPIRRFVAKSVIDVTLTALVGIVLLPVVMGLALLVRLTSPGPAFFRQTRVGVDGSTFTIWKLRSMYVDADARRAELEDRNEGAGLLFKMKDDPRVTPVGRFLRRFSLDELPQLWNVVRGDMSLVGPRPPLESEVAAYPDEVRRRLRVRPGLTGLWQVSGRSDLDWDEAVRLDLRYVDNWSVAMDAMILWKTFRAVVSSSGAY